ncbi:hypothetical protein C7445_11125 [Alicyclobacillus sacchari]|uniref:Uncharacterized protein n=1 Tax=Alicyclobacillus sacchari TaxID=392010 RepID=A0A4R8LJ27_9BACL|nr:hypothetical protein [Alicyclobacillus sacchari]TDY43378.1 hypothetical protein C7445_11125 [Alicyclobacillus sacchari]GMA55879.1 hypothetical protein GCM10025858_03820 [Alicyclobacillus sacchari]
MRNDESDRESGAVLIYVLTTVTALGIVLSTLVYTGRIVWMGQARQLQFVQCSVVGRSVAEAALRDLQAGQKLPASDSWTIAGDQVTMGCIFDGRNVSARIDVVSGSVSDTISFVYDTIARTTRAWQDNGPGLTE